MRYEFCLLSFILGAGILFLLIRPRLKATQKLDKETIQQNELLQKEQISLQNEIKVLSVQKSEITNSVADLQNYANEYYNKNIELANERLEKSLERAAQEYQETEDDYKEEYLHTLNECVEAFLMTISNQKEEVDSLTQTLTNLRSTVEAAVEAAKREVEKETQLDFYRLVLTDADISEIERLREVIPYLRDKEPLNKVIYKCYYEKPYTDLIGRVVGSKVKTGIYKITNIENQMCYVGQAVNIADRWKQHIKRGVGAEPATRNKLYPAMYKLGPENFTFEIIEECPRSDLDKREDYWQEYFKAKEFGYSIK